MQHQDNHNHGHDHTHHHHGHNHATPVSKQKDPVCGMDVDPATAKGTSAFQGKRYFFCNTKCQAKFDANPESFLGEAKAPERKTTRFFDN